ncbi:putative protein N(5)-glutamine methyltransferase [Isoptericola aurantiacus]|uniref:putative protein N(5)-glutamine methyltransferase n=1 Tax=Isoptericola aurantiacus TaxID=3377839 RepID=UPI00383B8B05
MLATRLRAAGCVFAEEEAALLLAAEPADAAALEALIARRVAGEPLEHLLGTVELAGRRWSVGPGVFVPRRRSELMVRTALELRRDRSGVGPRPLPAPTSVVDLCCGCGAVGGSVVLGLRALPGAGDVRLHAVDVEAAAAVHARRNLEPLGGVVLRGDLFDPLPEALRGGVDLLLCHAPYVPTAAIATMPPEARDHEPRVALDGGADGLDVLRRVLAGAPAWLAPGGALLFEVATAQVDPARAEVVAVGLDARVVEDDELGATVVVAADRRLPGT